jgi:hypothetical protein
LKKKAQINCKREDSSMNRKATKLVQALAADNINVYNIFRAKLSAWEAIRNPDQIEAFYRDVFVIISDCIHKEEEC